MPASRGSRWALWHPLLWCALLCALPPAARAQTIWQRVPARDETGEPLYAALVRDEGQPAFGRGARVILLDTEGQTLWDDFDASLHPWLLRSGRFAGRNVLLVGVRKTAVFDPAERKRPFIYEIKASGRGLRKIWLGTSLSRPFETADLANLDGTGEDELVALEHTTTGGLGLGAYIWKGFGIEGLARSGDIAAAGDLRCGDVWGDDREEVVVLTRTGTLWSFEAYALRGEELVPVALTRATVTADAVQWGLVPAGGRASGAVELRGKVTRRLPFRAATADDGDDGGTG